MSKIGIIAGSGVDFQAANAVIIKRHGAAYCPPHEVDFCGNLQALKQKGVDKIIATAAVGSMNLKMKPGDLVLLSDFIDFTRSRAEYINSNAFTDVSFPYDEGLRKKIQKAAAKLKIKIHPAAVYVCTEGPRFETRAEIKMYRKLGGDVVGMTQVPEVVLAAEAGIPYAAIGVVTNYAAGISPKRISSEEVILMMKKKAKVLSRLILQVLKTL